MRKTLTFSPEEWEQVESRYAASEARSFTAFARQAVMEGEIRVRRVALDPAHLRADLSRIGNNINQIARRVNAQDVVTYDEVRAVRVLLGQVQGLISSAITSVEGDP